MVIEPTRFPRTVAAFTAVAELAATDTVREDFEFGLARLLDGIEAMLPRRDGVAAAVVARLGGHAVEQGVEPGRGRGPMGMRRVLRATALIALVPVIAVAGWLLAASVLYTPEYVGRVLAWQESDVSDYLVNFPKRPLAASPHPRPFSVALDEDRVEGVLASALDVDDLDAFLEETETQSLIVVVDDDVVLERYANGWQRDSMVTSFSVAKSFVSTLVGIAIEEGAIGSLDDPITTYLPELAQRDPRFGQITIRHLLQMSSGLDYEESGWFLFNGDDPLTTYHPDQRTLALTNTRIERPAGRGVPSTTSTTRSCSGSSSSGRPACPSRRGPSRACGIRWAWSSTAPGPSTRRQPGSRRWRPA